MIRIQIKNMNIVPCYAIFLLYKLEITIYLSRLLIGTVDFILDNDATVFIPKAQVYAVLVGSIDVFHGEGVVIETNHILYE